MSRGLLICTQPTLCMTVCLCSLSEAPGFALDAERNLGPESVSATHVTGFQASPDWCLLNCFIFDISVGRSMEWMVRIAAAYERCFGKPHEFMMEVHRQRFFDFSLHNLGSLDGLTSKSGVSKLHYVNPITENNWRCRSQWNRVLEQLSKILELASSSASLSLCMETDAITISGRHQSVWACSAARKTAASQWHTDHEVVPVCTRHKIYIQEITSFVRHRTVQMTTKDALFSAMQMRISIHECYQSTKHKTTEYSAPHSPLRIYQKPRKEQT